MMPFWRPRGLACLIGLLLGLTAAGAVDADNGSQTRTAIMALFAASDAAWSAGQLESFMREYEDSPLTTYMHSERVITGRDTIRDHYKLFGTDAVTMGRLVIKVENLRFLERNYALATGHYQIERSAGSGHVREGGSTLVLHHSSKGWGVISDHS